METWLKDANGNRCSVEYFGSKEAAQAALDSLKDCRNCTNCSDCSGCSNCSRCSGCLRCSNCSDCSGCLDLKNSKPMQIPKIENIHTKVWEAVRGEQNRLEMRDWHTCETTHCRGGWVVHLAGKAGYALEAFHGTELAAMLIYRESSPHRVNPARFYDTNDAALADIKRMADLEATP